MSESNACEIRIRIHEEMDLYHPLDPDQKLLCDDVISYLQRKYNDDSQAGRKMTIQIVSDQPVNEERVRSAFHDYVDHEYNSLVREQRRTRIRQLRLFLIGIFFIAIWLYFSMKKDNIFVEVLSIIGSFAVWEASDIWIVESPELRIRKRRTDRLHGTEIRFACSLQDEVQKGRA